MKPRCVQAVAQALGRPLRAAEDREITETLRGALRQMQSQDPAGFFAMTESERLTQAATIAAQRLVSEAELKQRRVALQILAQQRIDDMIQASPNGGLATMDRLMAFDADQRSGVMSVEAQRRAIRAIGISRLASSLDENNGAGWKLFADDKGVHDVVREAHGQRTGNADAARVAQAFRDIAEQNRQRFNSAGGDIGYLEDWGVPHSHSQHKIANAGMTRNNASEMAKLNKQRAKIANKLNAGDNAYTMADLKRIDDEIRTRANASQEKVEEYLAAKQSFSQRFGCRVFVEKGKVTDTRFGEMPAE